MRVPYPLGPRLVQLGGLEGGTVVEQHAEGQEGLDRHRVESGGLGDHLPHPPEAVAHGVANLGVAACGEALELQEQRGTVGQHLVVLSAHTAERLEPGLGTGGVAHAVGHAIERRDHHLQEQRLFGPEHSEDVGLGDFGMSGDYLG
jgi:hypothetical protein